MNGRHVLAETHTAQGRLVQVEWRTWQHVVHEHPELEGLLADVLDTIAAPDHREPDPRPGRERYFRRHAKRGWIRVVTEFGGTADRVVTAFLQENPPSPAGFER